MADTFEKFVEKERARLAKERQALLAEQKATADKLASVDKELLAITAYEDAKKGKPKRATGPRGPRQGTSKRAELLQLIKDSPSGMSRGDILERLGLKGNKSGEQSVSNGLTALKKAGTITSKDGKYHAAT